MQVDTTPFQAQMQANRVSTADENRDLSVYFWGLLLHLQG